MSYQPSQACSSYTTTSTTSTLAIVSLVFGILTWVMVPFIGAIVAIVCGHLARSEIRRAPPGVVIEGVGMAIAGLVLGYAHLVFAVVVVLALMAVLFLGIGSFWH